MRKELPNYDVPQYPISLASQRKLDVLAQKYKRRNLADKHAKALKQLGECIHDLQQELGNMEDVVEKQKRKDEKGVEDANVELWQDKLNAFKPKHHNLAKRLEKSARTCVDLTQRHDAVVRAAEQSAHAAAVSQTQRPRAARNTQDGDMSSFEPTLPGATGEAGEGDTTMAEVESTLETFKKRRRDQVEAWTSLSLLARYGQHRGYVDFREQEHEGYYGDEQDAPPSTQWFAEEEPAPGTTTQGAAEESDDDIQVARSKISTKCPLTLKEFEDPVMSTACRHTFEKSAIYELLGRRPQTQCPVGGCPNVQASLSLLSNLTNMITAYHTLAARAKRQAHSQDPSHTAIAQSRSRGYR
jgi:hypothetical protein